MRDGKADDRVEMRKKGQRERGKWRTKSESDVEQPRQEIKKQY